MSNTQSFAVSFDQVNAFVQRMNVDCVEKGGRAVISVVNTVINPTAKMGIGGGH